VSKLGQNSPFSAAACFINKSALPCLQMSLNNTRRWTRVLSKLKLCYLFIK